MAMSIALRDGSFLWLWLAAKAIQGLNSVACNAESSDLVVWGEYSCGVDDL